MLLVIGTTWTRFRLRLEASLLTITAGRVFWISPPGEGSKSTHQTSPRSIWPVPCHIADDTFRPLLGVALAFLVSRHFEVCSFDVLRYDVWPGEFLKELADSPASDGTVEALVDFLANHYRKLAIHNPLYVLYTYSVAAQFLKN